MMGRWLKFNAVGLLGVLVQLAVFAVLTCIVRLDYLLATFLAVELTVLHNFWWHERWTWRDRRIGAARGMLERLFRFNLTNGSVSIAGNMVLMALLAGWLGMPHLAAGAIAVSSCSVFNFLLSDRLVFAGSPSH